MGIRLAVLLSDTQAAPLHADQLQQASKQRTRQAAPTTLRKRPLSVRTSTSDDGNRIDGADGAGRRSGGFRQPLGEARGRFLHHRRHRRCHAAQHPGPRRRHRGPPRALSTLPQQSTDKDGNLPWAPTTVNVEDQLICPRLDPAAVAADPDKAVEDYVASLSTLPMDWSRPLWEFHLFDLPTFEAAAIAPRWVSWPPDFRGLGDGISLLTLLLAYTSSAADHAAAAGAHRYLAYLAWVWSFFVLSWHTAVDFLAFFATILCIRDPHTLFKLAREPCGVAAQAHRASEP
ncbi:hypothetical protein ACQ4PT_004253 [Festuca glaucescens]